MFAVETNFNDALDYLFDLTTTEDEIIMAAEAEAGIARHDSGAINVSRTIRNVALKLVDCALPGEPAVIFPEDVQAHLFQLDIEVDAWRVKLALYRMAKAHLLWKHPRHNWFMKPLN